MLDRRGFVAGMASLTVGASGCLHGEGSGSQDGEGSETGEEEESVSDENETGTRFALYVTTSERYLVATEEGVEPNSVSKREARGGRYRVVFELTDEGVHELEETVKEQMEERDDGTLTVEFDGEVVFDGPLAPTLWDDVRAGEYSERDGRLSVTGLDKEEADELVGVLSES